MIRRKYGFLPTSEKGLSAENFVGIIVIVAFVMLLASQSAPGDTLRRPKQPSNARLGANMIYHTKPACEDVKCWIIHYSNIYDVDSDLATRIAFAESSFNPQAVNYNTNGSKDGGLFQINSIHQVPDSCTMDMHCNIKWALDKMQKVGTQPWYSSKNKWYEKEK